MTVGGSRHFGELGQFLAQFNSLPTDRLARWLDSMETACLTAMRHLDEIESWSARAVAEMTSLSGKTPRALRAVLIEWPLYPPRWLRL
jgi:hypothetical protein